MHAPASARPHGSLCESGSMENHWVGGRKEEWDDQEGLKPLLLAHTAEAIALSADSRDVDGNL